MVFFFRTCVFCGIGIAVDRKEALPRTRRCYQCALKEGPDLEKSSPQVGMDPETYRDLLRAIRS